MSTGTLIRAPGLAKEVSADRTQDCIPREPSSPEEQIHQQLMRSRFGPELFFRMRDVYFADATYFSSMFRTYVSGTSVGDWGTIETRTPIAALNVWHSPKFKQLVAKPIGAPVELTMEEADEIVRLAFGRRPDLPPGKQVVREVREQLGHSVMERLKKVD